MNKSQDFHLVWPDFLRTLATLFVIFIHSVSLDPGHSNYTVNLIIFAVAKSSVPVFTMLSGALLLDKDEHLTDFFKKRMGRITGPYLFWTCVFVLWSFFFRHSPIDSPLNLIRLFYVGFMTGIWFLPVLIGLYIVTPFLKIFVKKDSRYIYLFLIIWLIIFSIIPLRTGQIYFQNSLKELLYSILAFSGYFLMGHILTRSKTPNNKSGLILIISGLLISFMLFFYTGQSKRSFEYFEYLFPGTMLISVGIFSTFRNILLNKSYNEEFLLRTLKYLSGLSLGVLFIHQFVLEVIRVYIPQTKYMDLGNSIALTLIIFTSSIMILSILNRITGLKKLIA